MKKMLLALMFAGVVIAAGCSGAEGDDHNDGDDHDDEHSAVPAMVWNA